MRRAFSAVAGMRCKTLQQTLLQGDDKFGESARGLEKWGLGIMHQSDDGEFRMYLSLISY